VIDKAGCATPGVVYTINDYSNFHFRMQKLFTILLFMLVGITAASAQRTIVGRVVDTRGDGLIGASIKVKGEAKGTVTDIEGRFRLETTSANPVLTVSYTGFLEQEVVVGASNALNITMEENANTIAETVITAFGQRKDKSNLGYAVGQVSSDELTVGRVTNVTNALTGKVAGVRISGSGGSFSGSSILIRGNTTFTGSNQPLFVVDGIPIDNGGGDNLLQNGAVRSNRAIDLNQEDIEEISVLKGAAATALYGSRAANGVILITTKKGQAKSKNSITYNANYAIQEVNRLPDYQNIYGQGAGGVFNPTAISSFGPIIRGQRVALPADYRAAGVGDSVSMAAYPNNVSDLFKRGPNTQHNLAFQGGSDKTTYRLSLGFLDDQGVLTNNRLKRYNLGLNASQQITEKLKAGVSVNYALNKSVRSQQGNQLSNPLFRSWFTPRSWDLTGLPYQTATGTQLHYDPLVDNPRWTLENNLYDDQIDRIFGNVELTYNLASWLTANYKIGVDKFDFSRRGYDQIGARGAANANANLAGGILEGRNASRNINSYLTLSANKQLTKNIQLSALLGNEIVDEYFNNSQLIGRGLVVRDFRDLDANTLSFVPEYRIEQGRIIGLFGNVTAVYKNWATLDLSLRNDWNSTLRQGNNSYLYYSVAGTLNLTEMIPGLKSDFINQLKIRSNYGRTGRAALRYSTDTYFSQPNPLDGFGPNIQFPFNNLPGYTLNNTAGNPNLGPEFTTSFEVGGDITLLKERIALELTYYKQESTGIILEVPNSPTAGFTNVAQNVGRMSTPGWEVGLILTPIKTRHGQWETVFNFTRFVSTVDELAPGVQNIFLGGFTTPNVRLVAGDQYGQLYGNKYLRDDQGRLRLTAAGLPQPTANVDRIGNPNPDWVLGVNNTITLFGFSINCLLDIKKGGQQYSRNLADLQRNGVAAETAELDRFNADGTVARPYRFDGVLPDGRVNEGPNAVFVTAEQYWGNAGKHVAAGTSWFRVREAGINYDLPKKWLEKTPFGAFSLGVFGRNLFLHAPDYPHLDPEQNVLGISNAQGLEFNALPQMRSYGVNLRITL
jgi:TonB-linked SusC/RagA family outer membrane protein